MYLRIVEGIKGNMLNTLSHGDGSLDYFSS